jgi:hypothetical protein
MLQLHSTIVVAGTVEAARPNYASRPNHGKVALYQLSYSRAFEYR